MFYCCGSLDGMHRLSGLDASFLYLETSSQLLRVCGLVIVDPSTMPGGYSFHKLAAPEPWALADAMPEALAELLEAAG
jgi:diacylglycerol O-acyltransferase